MLKIPDASQFGGKSNIPANITQSDWLTVVKNRACVGCHQLGQLSTRTIPAALGEFGSSEAAWIRRVQSGQAAPFMLNPLTGVLGGAPFKYFGDWTDRVAKGELPHSKPTRPQGVERNIVVTTWEWGDPKKYLHDLIASDRRYPTVNAYGPLYGSPEYATDVYPILDPKTHTVTSFTAPVRDADTPEAFGPGHAAIAKPMAPSPYWGDEKIWDTKANNHNGMFDRKGRVWFAATVRGPKNPSFCQKGSDHPSAKLFPVEQANRHLTMLDPKTKKYTFVDTCFQTHHLQFGYDANDTLWTSGGGPVVGWVNTQDVRRDGRRGEVARVDGVRPRHQRQRQARRLRRARPAGRSDQGQAHRRGLLCRDAEPGRRLDLGLRRRLRRAPRRSCGSFRGRTRRRPRSRRSTTCRSPISASAAPTSTSRASCGRHSGAATSAASTGASARGPLNGPKATGDHCPEGWAFYQYPGPGFQGIGENSAESSYYTWVDQHNTFGLGDDIPMSTANLNDGLVALKDGKMILLRVPYPLGFYAKGFDGRIDDPNAGWKGRGLWTTSGDRTPWLMEGGKGKKPIAVHFQLRPDPLAH